MDWIQFLSGLVVIVGANFAYMKFLLKDTKDEIKIIRENQTVFQKEIKELRQEFREENRMTNMRLDGLYKVLIEKAYGIKE